MSPDSAEVKAFAESVAGVLVRHARTLEPWSPGRAEVSERAELTRALDEIGWALLADDPGLVTCAGAGAIELGRRLAPLREIDRLLGGGPTAGGLVRSLGSESLALTAGPWGPEARTVVRSELVASAEGLDVRRVLEAGEARAIATEAWIVAANAWMAASVGYLAGLGQGALELSTDYVRQRRAFSTTLGALAPVQQLLADAATLARGVRLLAVDAPDHDALAHSGHAVAAACAACQQVSGAIGFTLEYPLHRYTQRARALAVWNDALLESLLQRPAMAC